MKRKLRIFDYCWHIAHQWDMVQALKDDCEFFYCLNVKRQWDVSIRPLPPEIHFVTHYTPGAYDVAILHIDQQVIETMHQKRMVYEQFNRCITDIPRIVINHGSPVNPEYVGTLFPQATEEWMQQYCIAEVKKILGGNTMVVNSHAAASAAEWGFGYPIVHGMSPDEWLDLPKEPRVFTALSPGGLSAYYNRECMVKMSDILYDKYGYVLCYAHLNVDVDQTPEAYKTFLGSSLLYVDTSYRTPMNRSRTEAMLSGCCVVQVAGAHDLDLWAQDGKNIVIVPDDPERIASVIASLLSSRYAEALEIGRCGKAMARLRFSRERYRLDWLHLFQLLRLM